MLFAEFTLDRASTIIVSIFGGSGVATIVMVWWFKFRDQRRELRAKEAKDERDGRREELAIENEAFRQEAELEDNRRQAEVNDLREENSRLRRTLTTLQEGVANKIIAAHESHHECEKKYAALEVMFKNSERRVSELEARITSLEGRK